MDARIAEFAQLLRHNGVRVGPAEIADAVLAAALVGVEDRCVFRSALCACLIKRSAEVPAFDRLFEHYFGGASRLFEEIDKSLARALEEAGLLEGDELAMVLATLERLAGEMSPLARAALAGDRASLASLFAGAALAVDFGGLESRLQQGFYARRLVNAAGMSRAERDLAEIEAALKAQGLREQGLEIVGRELSRALRRVEQAARARVEREVRARARAADLLEDRRFFELSAEELERTARAVRRLAERLKARLVRRERSRRRGALHVRRTLRKNLSWGGVPARLAFRARRPQRPDVVVLCDVSDSVRNVSRMMLLFVHTLQSLFNRVRTFVFVSELGEATEYFRSVDARQALDRALAGKVIDVSANSNYGRAFASFARDHLGAVRRRTTVLVIGDGRNNYHPANAWALEAIRAKSRRLVWICPEDRRAWGVGDSEMLRYERLCERVAVVQSLRDLEKVADALLPRGG